MSNKVKRLLELQAQIKYHDYMYFDQDKPVISDAKYDEMVAEYQELLEEHPEFDPAKHTVGFVAPDPSMETVMIVEPMLSIGKRKTKADFQKWITQNVSTDAIYEDKLDGMALRIVYHYGELMCIHTRGNGTVGAVLSHRRHLLLNVPDYIAEDKEEPVTEYTGEALCMYADFEAYAKRHELDIKDIDTRSTVSGLMKRQKSSDRDDLPIYFKCYNASSNVRNRYGFYTQLRQHFIASGFDLPKLLSPTAVEALLDLPSKPIDTYPVDGIVAKDDDLRSWDKEQDAQYYSYAICYKYPTLALQSKVTGIDWSIANSGELIGTLMYEPVDYDGTKLSRCKLDYAASYFEKGLRINSIISVTKSNEIVPKLVSLVEPGTGLKLSYPEFCPFCNKPVRMDDDNKVAFCVNPDCEGQLLKQLTRLSEIDAFDIKGLGPKRIQALLDHGFLSNPSDLFELTEEDLINAGIDLATSGSIMEQIGKLDDKDISRWLVALAIPELGVGRAIDISNLAATNGMNDGLKFSNLDDFIRIMTDGMFLKNTFGLDGLVIGMHIKTHEEEIRKFLSHYTFNKERTGIAQGVPVSISGGWPVLTRGLLAEGLANAGYVLSDTVSQSAKVLLTGTKPSPGKIAKANRWGIPIINITSVYDIATIAVLIANANK
ncbi:putative NAD-dependent DNA ligase [Pseudomonas phage OBP]|uniref:NAD-dependent DNA ligase n=1 Tax=Pseudomonas phage OBP TaxID=1124849 RepID=UPI000240D56E|nr:NAD-dependent DNA ligase [Pseudomonas phage OBP]AEV89590.1 putative NAD-dependent DNA ligase [Pseudomonas phage OBP]